MAFYWYQSDPDLYRAEVQAMNKFFPSFTIHQLPDGSGRLYWRCLLYTSDAADD